MNRISREQLNRLIQEVIDAFMSIQPRTRARSRAADRAPRRSRTLYQVLPHGSGRGVPMEELIDRAPVSQPPPPPPPQQQQQSSSSSTLPEWIPAASLDLPPTPPIRNGNGNRNGDISGDEPAESHSGGDEDDDVFQEQAEDEEESQEVPAPPPRSPSPLRGIEIFGHGLRDSLVGQLREVHLRINEQLVRVARVEVRIIDRHTGGSEVVNLYENPMFGYTAFYTLYTPGDYQLIIKINDIERFYNLRALHNPNFTRDLVVNHKRMVLYINSFRQASEQRLKEVRQQAEVTIENATNMARGARNDADRAMEMFREAVVRRALRERPVNAKDVAIQTDGVEKVAARKLDTACQTDVILPGRWSPQPGPSGIGQKRRFSEESAETDDSSPMPPRRRRRVADDYSTPPLGISVTPPSSGFRPSSPPGRRSTSASFTSSSLSSSTSSPPLRVRAPAPPPFYGRPTLTNYGLRNLRRLNYYESPP